MTKHFGFRYVSDGTPLGGVMLDISETRWWWDVPVHVADALCALSRHRLCNSLVVWAYNLNARHVRRELAVPATRELWASWAKLAGAEDPSWRWDDDDDAGLLAIAEARLAMDSGNRIPLEDVLQTLGYRSRRTRGWRNVRRLLLRWKGRAAGPAPEGVA